VAEEITRTRPAEFIEQAGKVYTNKLFGTTEKPGVLGQAVDTSQFAPSVAGLSALQKASMQAQATQAGLGAISYDPTTGLASGVGQGTGIGAFQPFLDESQRLAGAIGPDGRVTSAGVTAAMDPFMTPYQQQVIDASMASYQNQRAQGRQSIADQAIQAGAFGGGREGVQRGVYDAQTTLGATQLEADLRAQNFAQAQAAQQAAMQNQQGLATLVPGLQQTQATQIGALGSQQQALRQSQLDAQAAANREAAYEEQQRIGFAGQQFAPLMGGIGASTQYSTSQATPPSTLQTILGTGTGIAGIAGAAMKGFG
tara:strand:- start:713 stop:1648 length:936 start_codon:yes stop_codon:yes gene_type:complete